VVKVPFIATQLNSTRRRYKHPLQIHRVTHVSLKRSRRVTAIECKFMRVRFSIFRCRRTVLYKQP